MTVFPSGAKKVFSGVKSEVFQWQQEMFDGSLVTFEKVVRQPTATILALWEGKILITDQEQPGKSPFIALPGGYGEPGELPLQTAQRELLEETGLVSEDWHEWQVLGSRDYIHWENHFLIAKNCRKAREPMLDSGEKITCRLISFDEFLALADEPRFRHKDLLHDMHQMIRFEANRTEMITRLGL